MKKIILSLLLIVCLFSLAGCQGFPVVDNSFIMVSLGKFASGKTIQKFDFSLDSNFLKENGMSENDLEQAKQNLVNNVDVFRKEFVISFELIYQKAENKNLDYLVNGKYLTITQTAYNQNADTVSFSIIFENQELWEFYHTSTKQQPEVDGENESGISFVEKQSSTGKFPFASEVEIGDGQKITVAERYRQAYLDSISFIENFDEISNKYLPDLVYNYGTQYGNIKSDAQTIFQDTDGLYHHVWVENFSNLSTDDTITLYVNSANQGWWYLFYLVLILTLMSGAIITVKLIKNKKNKKA